MLLISPAEEKFGGVLSPYVRKGLPIAIGTLASYLIKHKIESRILDEEMVDITPEVLDRKLEGLEKPYIIGISCLTAHVVRGYALIKMIKARYPDATVILGGLHPTALPDEGLLEGADFVVRGEGEDTLLKLHNMIRAGATNYSNLLGITYWRDGQIAHNPDAPLMPDLDAIPPFPYHLFDEHKDRYDMGVVTSSRGCPFRCNYCSIRMMNGLTYRYKSSARLIEEITLLVDKYGAKQVLFYDDNFAFKKRRVKEFCDALIAAGLHKRCAFSIQTRADNFYPDVVPLLAEAGFRDVGFGMETGVDRLETIIAKGETVEMHRKAVELARKHGFSVSLFMIFGLPTETAADRETSFRVVQEMGTVASKYNNLIPYPGTPFFEDARKTDRIHISPRWSNFNSTLSVTRSIFDKTPLPYVPDTCSEFELKRDIVKYNLKTYFQPKALLPLLIGKKGIGWYQMPPRWYFKPVEIYKLARMAISVVLVNMVVTSLPLWLTEPFMNLLNPAMRRRPRLRDTPDLNYKGSSWSQESGTRIKIAAADSQLAGSGLEAVV
ncbi:MAG: B12-binding domain-containing radical SAM protein [Elusimicrobia bacterium]|nr:B12-binding domain-containing radical SAM protein [Elusimicrobiota bacterium]